MGYLHNVMSKSVEMPSRKRSGLRLLESTSWVRFLPFSFFAKGQNGGAKSQNDDAAALR